MYTFLVRLGLGLLLGLGSWRVNTSAAVHFLPRCCGTLVLLFW